MKKVPGMLNTEKCYLLCQANSFHAHINAWVLLQVNIKLRKDIQ